MAFVFDTDIYVPPITGFDVVFFRLKQLLKVAGWTVPRSSDGLTYNSSGDQITSPARGPAGGMGNDSAWFVIVSPDGHAWLFKRGIGLDFNVTGYAISVSRAAGFTGGAPDAVTPPTAADQGWLFTDTNSLYFTSRCRFNMGAENVAPYRFWAAPLANDQYINTQAIIFMDGLAPTAGAALDPDPFIYSVSSSFCGYSRATTPDQRFAKMQQIGISQTGGSNQFNGKDDFTSAVYAYAGRGQGIKGIGSMIRVTTNSRRPGSLLTLSTPGDLLVLGQDSYGNGAWLVPWNGALPRRDV